VVKRRESYLSRKLIETQKGINNKIEKNDHDSLLVKSDFGFWSHAKGIFASQLFGSEARFQRRIDVAMLCP
jgi:hypothetical protein